MKISFSFVLSALALVSAGVLYTYLEASPQVPTPLDAMKAFVFPNGPSSSLATVQAPPAFDFSEANLLLAWAVLTAAGICVALSKALTLKVTRANAQPRAITVVCSLLAATCLLVLTPLLMSVYRASHG